MDLRFIGEVCPVCGDPWCSGCEEVLLEEADVRIYRGERIA